MNGIPKSPLNRYIQVTDVVVAHNSWINCSSPLQFGVGSNVDQNAVLPASEIRSEKPIRTIVANNLIYNEESDKQPIVAHDSLDGINFKNNLINNQGSSFNYESGFHQEEFSLVELEGNILIPSKDLPHLKLYKGFEFDQITKDLFDNVRADRNEVGAIVSAPEEKLDFMDVSKYGPDWYTVKEAEEVSAQTINVVSPSELENAVKNAKNRDIIVLAADSFNLKSSLKIDKILTIKSVDSNKKATISYNGEAQTPVFEMNPKGQLTLDGVKLKGENIQYAFASLKANMSSLYNVTVLASEISDFDYVLRGYKHSFSEYIKFTVTTIKNCANGIELAAEDDDKGEYNAENIFINNCKFEGVPKNVINYYRGGYDESTVGGNLIVKNSIFTRCGANEENGILLKTYGIINVDLANNTFLNNKVKMVALLWGAKNNRYSNNEIKNSGELVVQENLPLKLMY